MTALSVGDTFRLTMRCSTPTSSHATTIASIVPCGADACPPVPCTSIASESELAVTEPGAQPTVPADA
eukprot:6025569-Prymnesium_polylepis.1